jgi:hypothetical protein
LIRAAEKLPFEIPVCFVFIAFITIPTGQCFAVIGNFPFQIASTFFSFTDLWTLPLFSFDGLSFNNAFKLPVLSNVIIISVMIATRNLVARLFNGHIAHQIG